MSPDPEIPFTDKKFKVQAEFDRLADDYLRQHKENVAVTGESPEYFARYKIADLASYLHGHDLSLGSVLDFGSGIGNSIPYFRKYFGQSRITYADVSERSIEISKKRFPGMESYVLIGQNLPIPSESQDVVFSACVFHHIPEEEHDYWLLELMRVVKPGGVLAIYEHNPKNPLTVRAVNACPLDINAELIESRTLCRRAINAGWEKPSVAYKLFFPAFFSYLRFLEKHLEWVSFGAQYRLIARRPKYSVFD